MSVGTSPSARHRGGPRTKDQFERDTNRCAERVLSNVRKSPTLPARTSSNDQLHHNERTAPCASTGQFSRPAAGACHGPSSHGLNLRPRPPAKAALRPISPLTALGAKSSRHRTSKGRRPNRSALAVRRCARAFRRGVARTPEPFWTEPEATEGQLIIQPVGTDGASRPMPRPPRQREHGSNASATTHNKSCPKPIVGGRHAGMRASWFLSTQ